MGGQMIAFTDRELAALPVPPQVFARVIACLLGKTYTPDYNFSGELVGATLDTPNPPRSYEERELTHYV